MNEPIQRAMFGLGPTELVIILIIVMLIFGAGKLPQVGEGLGKMISGFRKGAREVDEEVADIKRTLADPLGQPVRNGPARGRRQVVETEVETVETVEEEEEHHA